MSDREKVIKGLECCIKKMEGQRVCDECPYDEDFNCLGCSVALRQALALLREQEPVNVVMVQNIQTNTYDWGEETEIRTDFFCPDCKEIIASGWTSKFHYCPWCGRAVKWDADN